jgi:hypothetical protein
MSRLQPLHIPFAQGLDDRVDAKVLPDGLFTRLENCRYTKAGSLRLRRGWRPISTSSVNEVADGGTVRAIDLYSVDRTLVALSDETGTFRTPNVAVLLDEASATAAWRRENGPGMQLPPVTDVRVVGNLAQINGVTRRASAALTADGAYGLVLTQTTAATGTTTYRVFRTADDTTVVADLMSNGGRDRKVVAAGQLFYLVENDGSGLELYVLDPTAAAPAWTSVGTLTTAGVTEFDAVVARVASPAALHIAAVASADSNAYYWRASLTTGAVLAATTKTVTATGDIAAVALGTDDTTVTLLFQHTTAAGGDCEWEVWGTTPPYTTTSGPNAAFLAAETAQGRIACACEGSSVYMAAGDATAGVPGPNTFFHYATTAGATRFRETRAQAVLTGGFAADSRRGGFGVTRDSAMVYGDAFTPWLVLEHGVGSSSVVGLGGGAGNTGAPFSPGGTPGGSWLVLGNQSDPSFDVFTAVRMLRLNSTERRPGATLGSRLYFSGGMVSQYGGHETSEVGMLAPVLASITPSNGAGSLTNSGVYDYRAIVSWTDSKGELHRSIVSLPSSVTLGASDDTVTLVYAIPPTMRRNRELGVDPKLEVYRTEAGPGELFYFAGSAVAGPTTDLVSFVDLASDASLLDNQRLYTEGDTGIGSGQLDITPSNPASFLSAVRDRLVGGSSDQGYQFSQLVLPSTPAGFTQPGVSGPVALVYQDAIEGRITGVAALDDTVIVGTATRLYVTGGDGPNLSGQGQFQSPARLPSDVGFYDARSIVEDSAGLWFLGAEAQLYVLPRGQGSPVFAGESVQDQFAGGEVVGAARDLQDSVTVWAVAGASAATSKLVWRRAETGQWGTDTLPFIPAALVEHEGRLYAAASDGVVWRQDAAAYGDGAAGATGYTSVVATGDVQVFGLGGWGRIAALELQATLQSNAQVLCEVSYDQGVTWTSLSAQTVLGSAGDAIQRQWFPARQRGGKFRVRWTVTPGTSTGEGLRLTGFTIWHTTRSGPTRLDSGKRI